ncbi:diadenylate cyclase [Brevundimonas nasdae]|nr:diadenylate cyclase [Brevundimonas nasdae]
MARVFNYDVAVAPGLLRDKELWLNLQQTRFSRVIARAASFHTDILFRWLRNYENAGSLRYEGSPFSAAMIIVKQRTNLQGKASLDFLKFSEPLALTRALFEEKWVRALASGGHVYLVGLGHDNGVIGVAVTRETDVSEGQLFPPHRNLSGLTSSLGPGMMALTMSESGDLYVLLPNGVTFVKSQGRWRYLNFNLLNVALSGCVQSSALPGLVRVIADMSYDRRGALFVVCDDRSAIKRVVPDHASSDRINKPVRTFARCLKVSDASHRLVLGNVAAIDGAVILSGSGEVLDAACMIATPSETDLASAGLARLSSHAGARTTAAWNASVLGTAVKVSEDGPISVFEKGCRVLQIG